MTRMEEMWFTMVDTATPWNLKIPVLTDKYEGFTRQYVSKEILDWALSVDLENSQKINTTVYNWETGEEIERFKLDDFVDNYRFFGILFPIPTWAE